MKKIYKKPEVCSIDFHTENVTATSAAFAERIKSRQEMHIMMSNPIVYEEEEEKCCENEKND